MIVRNGCVKDYQSIIDLDKKVFPAEWIVSDNFVLDVFRKNQRAYRVLEDEGVVRGHYCFFPLLKRDYENLLNGQIEEKDIPKYVVDYSFDKELYLYAATVLIDVNVNREKRKEYAKALTDDIPKFITGLLNEGFTIKEVGAIAITKVGNLYCRKIGMKKSHIIQEGIEKYTVFKLKL